MRFPCAKVTVASVRSFADPCIAAAHEAASAGRTCEASNTAKCPRNQFKRDRMLASDRSIVAQNVTITNDGLADLSGSRVFLIP